MNPAAQFHLLIEAIFALIWIGLVVFFQIKKGKDSTYLVLFTIFYVYLFKVLDYTLFQFQSLLVLRHFVPNLMLNGVEAGKSLNLIPLLTLTAADVKTSLLNILLFIPFGFGLPFITNLRMRNVVIVGTLASIAIESLQLITGLIGGITFRIADINDVIFNTVGVIVGCILYSVFMHICRRLFPAATQYIH